MVARCIALIALLAGLGRGTTYYLDCEAGSDAASGTSPQAAWRTLEKIAATTFQPGDSVLLRRGVRCHGMLWPKGSGLEGRPIRLGAYGEGPLPVIEAAGAEAAIKLFDQHHWQIENLHARGGSPFGVLVTGTKGHLRHFRLRNLLVEDVTGVAKSKSSGLVAVLAPEALQMEDVVIEGVTARRTTQWAGIIVRGGSATSRIRNVVIRNSLVYDVYGDGIVLFQVENGLIEKCAAWLTGLNPSVEVGTPNGIWTWRCRKCTVRLNEGFLTDSPGVDGGVYDIDWGNEDNLVEYNYGHDAQGYCVSVFGAHNEVTTNSVVRFNVCVNNGRSPKLARRQGDCYITTWEGGALDGVLIHNNTFYWTPPVEAPVLLMDRVVFRGARPNVFRNNVVFSTVPSMIQSSPEVRFEGNVYWYWGDGQPTWRHGSKEFRGFESWRKAIGAQDALADPRWDAMLRPRPGSPLLDLASRLRAGALEAAEPMPIASPAPLNLQARNRGRWLLAVLSGNDPDSCRSQLVFVQAALAQYGRRLLEAVLIWEGAADALGNLAADWRLEGIRVERNDSLRRALGIAASDNILTVLLDPAGQVVARWEGFVRPAEFGLALRYHLAPPPGVAPRHPLWPLP